MCELVHAMIGSPGKDKSKYASLCAYASVQVSHVQPADAVFALLNAWAPVLLPLCAQRGRQSFRLS